MPALTAEEWAAKRAMRNGVVIDAGSEPDNLLLHEDNTWSDVYTMQYPDRDALAALALYGQPFGFTREDVVNLRWVAGFLELEMLADEGKMRASFGRTVTAINRLSDRIEALLPSESPSKPEQK